MADPRGDQDMQETTKLYTMAQLFEGRLALTQG